MILNNGEDFEHKNSLQMKLTARPFWGVKKDTQILQPEEPGL